MNKRSNLVPAEGPSTSELSTHSHASGSANVDHNASLPSAPRLSIPSWHLRSRTNQALISAEVQEHCCQLWNTTLLGFMVVDVSGSIICLNENAQKLCAAKPGRSVLLATCINPDDVAPFHEFLSNVFQVGTGHHINLRVAQPMNGTDRFVRISAVSVGTLTAALILEDITQNKRQEADKHQTEEQLRQFERLGLVHAMSAGIAHDFKNVVQVIESYAAILSGQALESTTSQTLAKEIMSAASRGALLANRWLAFCRDGQLLKCPVAMGPFVNECLASIERTLLQSLQIEKDLPDDGLRCELDPCLIEQVLINLFLNARDAMTSHGILRVSVSPIHLSSRDCSEHNLATGAYARISITDNGRGIAADAIERVFEPFFTTKGTCAGTGLGLTLAWRIVQEHGGTIEVSSQVGVGSSFTIYLPALRTTMSR